MSTGRVTAAVATVTGLALVVAGSFLPWFRSGRRARSSYQLFDVVQRLDLLGDGLARLAVGAWLAVPLLAATSAALLLLARTRIGALLAVGVGVYTVVLASVVASSTSSWESGTIVAASGGVVATAAGIVLLAVTRRTPSHQAEPA